LVEIRAARPEDAGAIAQVHVAVLPGYDGEFKTLYRLPAYQRRGIGRALFCRLASRLTERSHGAGIAWVLAGNPAFAFYEALGWTDLPALARRATT
jgi:GNAT superfamily N-acetyltransferase